MTSKKSPKIDQTLQKLVAEYVEGEYSDFIEH